MSRLRRSRPTRIFLLLFRAYRRQRRKRDWLTRTDLLDLIVSIAGEEACAFLLKVARSREHWYIRYYAMVNLIELECRGWLSDSKRKRASDFYGSLLVYRDLIEGRIDRDEARRITLGRWKGLGDPHWEWLINLPPGGRHSPEDA